MRTRDYAYSRTKPITVKKTILAALDALIAGLLMILFIGTAGLTMWLIFGH